MMGLSTSTNILCERPDGSVLPVEETLRQARAAGFDTFDMSFYEWAWEGSDFFSEDWEKWAERIAETADELGGSFKQCHAYTYDFLNPVFSDCEKREQQEKLVRRSLDCCRILGADIIVTHPGMDVSAKYPREDVWQKNMDYLKRFLQYADGRGMKVAVENMYSCCGHPEEVFFALPEEIIAFIDEFHDPRMGVCWDFEHGAIQDMNQPEIIQKLGGRLMATHVSDTVSKDFEPFMHVMPFTGMTDWKPIMQALKETGYEGAFSFEAHNFTKKLPDELIPTALKFSWEIGRYLLEL